MKKRLLAAMMVLGMTLGLTQMPVMAESTELTTEAAAAQTETSATEVAGTEANAEETENPLTAQAVAGQEKIKVLLLPKFEIGTKVERLMILPEASAAPSSMSKTAWRFMSPGWVR